MVVEVKVRFETVVIKNKIYSCIWDQYLKSTAYIKNWNEIRKNQQCGLCAQTAHRRC